MLLTTERRSFCRLCTAGCGIVVTTEGHTVVDVRGDETHPISHGYTCVKGRSLGLAHHDPLRLDAPMVRRGGELVETQWNDWLEDLGVRLARIIDTHGPSSVGVFYSGGSYFDASGHRTREAFISALGTRSIYSSYTLDSPNKPLVAELVGGSVKLTPLPDLTSTKLMLIVATNPVISHGHGIGMANPITQLRRIRQQGELWVLDPRRTETAQLASRHLAARPGTDYAALAFLVRELLKDGADTDYLERYATGVDQLSKSVNRFTLDMAAAITGLAPAELLDLLEAVRRAGRISILTGTGASMSHTANVLEWLAWTLGIVTGSLDRPGGTWFNPGFFRQNDRVTHVAAPPDGNVAAGPQSRPELKGRNNQLPAVAIPDEIAAGNLRALIAVGANLVAAMPETQRVVDALQSLELFVSVDVVHNETTKLATHVAACAGQLERADLSSSCEIFQPAIVGQYTREIVPPAATRRPTWWILAQLADRIGLQALPTGVSLEHGDTDHILSAIAGNARASFEDLRGADGPLVADTKPIFGWVLEGSILPEGRWRLASTLLAQQLARLKDETRAAVRMIPRRERRQMNGYLRFLQRGDTPVVYINPLDNADALVDDNDLITVRTDAGTMCAQVRFDETILPGVVSIPHGWSAQSVNNLLSCSNNIDELTGMPLMSGVPVTFASRRGE